RSEDDVQLEFICKLSEFIESQIKSMKKDIDLIDAGSRGGLGGGTFPTGSGNPDDDEDTGPFPGDAVVVPITDDVVDNGEETDEEKEELKKWLLLRYPEYDNDETKLNLAISWFFK